MIESQLDAELTDLVRQHMRRDFTRLRTEETVGDALIRLRSHPPEGRIIYFYVVDEADHLLGVVPTRRLLLSPAEKPIAEIMVKHIIAIPDTATVLEACEFFTLHKLLAFPIVDEKRHLVGLVDVELYTNELTDLERREGNEVLFQLIGVHLTAAQQASPLLSFRRRFPWLLCNIGGGIVAAFLSGIYEDELARVVALALFIPVVLALAESVSIQSVSLALQSFQGQRPTWAAILVKIRRELLTGLFMGAASALIVGLVSLIWLRHVQVMVCLLGGISAGVAGAAVIGLAIPNLLRLMKLDPQVAAGPIALALADMLTLLLYFNLARWLFAT
jgi:magnesium transporter